MRIAQVSPLFESVPPRVYGGTERVVSYLTEELVRLGHDVTLFASGDSITSATLVPCSPRSLRLDTQCIDQLSHHIIEIERVLQNASQFDILHFHIDYLHFSIARRQPTPHLTTLHGRLDLPDLQYLYNEFSDVPVISISHAQRKPLPWIGWRGTVHHGLPRDLYSFRDGSDGYLAFLGRISPEKGVDQAIELAKQTGVKLKIAAKIGDSPIDQKYYQEKIGPAIKKLHPLIEYLGEIGEKEKNDFLGNACALAFLIDWPEPFGLVMIEALACGTPVIATRRGSVPEIIEDGVTGILVDSCPEAVRRFDEIYHLDREACRREFVKLFTVNRMAKDYLRIYNQIHRQDYRPLHHGRRIQNLAP